MRKTSLLLAVAAMFGITATSVQAAPVTENYSADVTVLEQIAINEDKNLDFGKIDKPKAGTSADYTISAAGVPQPVANDGSFISGAEAGQYDFTGTDGQMATIGATAGVCGGGLTLSALTLSAGPTVSLDAENVGLGGTLTVPAATVAGAYTCAYTLTASY
ncbi:MAG: DUF4402 domain-containing protein [Gammaproteobacteria bacterium]|nr:DUF4402 domain-containing protein [Gammaproteobacteria bacterium]